MIITKLVSLSILNFSQLADVNGNFTGNAGNLLRVNELESALEYTTKMLAGYVPTDALDIATKDYVDTKVIPDTTEYGRAFLNVPGATEARTMLEIPIDMASMTAWGQSFVILDNYQEGRIELRIPDTTSFGNSITSSSSAGEVLTLLDIPTTEFGKSLLLANSSTEGKVLLDVIEPPGSSDYGRSILLTETPATARALLQIPDDTAFMTDFGKSLVECNDSDAAKLLLETGDVRLSNKLLNGGFDYAQRVNPYIYSKVYDLDYYTFDRWKAGIGATTDFPNRNSELLFKRCNSTYVEYYNEGINSNHYARIKSPNHTMFMLLAQWLENNNTVPLLGKTVTFSIKIRGITGRTAQIGFLKNIGDANVIPRHFAYTNINEDTFSYSTGIQYMGNLVTCNLEAYFQEYHVTVLIPNNEIINNIAVCVIFDMINGDECDIAEAGLYLSSLPPLIWYPVDSGIEFAAIKRYCEKSYPVDLINQPIPSGSSTTITSSIKTLGTNPSRLAILLKVSYSVQKRITPTVIIYSLRGYLGRCTWLQKGGVISAENTNTTKLPVTTSSKTTSGFSVTNAATNNINISRYGISIHYLALADL